MKSKAEITIKRFSVAEVKPHPRNPRKHPEPGTPQWDRLKKSLTADYFDPIVINKQNGMLVSGHLRLKVLAEMGVKEVDAVVVDYDETTHLARLVAANKQAGADDLPKLKDVIDELDAVDIDLEAMTGWGMDEIEDLTMSYKIESVDLPTIPNGERSQLRQLTLTLSDAQLRVVGDAIGKAKGCYTMEAGSNKNSNGNAIAFICESFLLGQDD